MKKISEESGLNLQEATQEDEDLQAYQYRLTKPGGSWIGSVTLQLAALDEVGCLFSKVDGRSVCIDGIGRTLEVASPSNPFPSPRANWPK